MSSGAIVWCVLLTIGLIAHMIKDNTEFKKIKRLEDDVAQLRARGSS